MPQPAVGGCIASTSNLPVRPSQHVERTYVYTKGKIVHVARRQSLDPIAPSAPILVQSQRTGSNAGITLASTGGWGLTFRDGRADALPDCLGRRRHLEFRGHSVLADTQAGELQQMGGEARVSLYWWGNADAVECGRRLAGGFATPVCLISYTPASRRQIVSRVGGKQRRTGRRTRASKGRRLQVAIIRNVGDDVSGLPRAGLAICYLSIVLGKRHPSVFPASN